jgi:hypothetical protein
VQKSNLSDNNNKDNTGGGGGDPLYDEAILKSMQSGLLVSDELQNLQETVEPPPQALTVDMDDGEFPTPMDIGLETASQFHDNLWDDVKKLPRIVARGVSGAVTKTAKSLDDMRRAAFDYGIVMPGDFEGMKAWLNNENLPEQPSEETFELIRSYGGLFPADPNAGLMERMAEDVLPQVVTTAVAWKLMGIASAAKVSVGAAAQGMSWLNSLGIATKVGVASVVGSGLAGDEKSVGTALPIAIADYGRELLGGRKLTEDESWAAAWLYAYENAPAAAKPLLRVLDDLALGGLTSAAFEAGGKLISMVKATPRAIEDLVSNLGKSKENIETLIKAADGIPAKQLSAVAEAVAKTEDDIFMGLTTRVPKGSKLTKAKNGAVTLEMTLPNGVPVKLTKDTAADMVDYVDNHVKIPNELPEFPPMVSPQAVPEHVEAIAKKLKDGEGVSLNSRGEWVASVKTEGGATLRLPVTPENAADIDSTWLTRQQQVVVAGAKPTADISYAREIIDQFDHEGNSFSVALDGKVRGSYLSTTGGRVGFAMDQSEESIVAMRKLLRDNPVAPPPTKQIATPVVTEAPTKAPKKGPKKAKEVAPATADEAVAIVEEAPEVIVEKAVVSSSSRKALLKEQPLLKDPMPVRARALGKSKDLSRQRLNGRGQIIADSDAAGDILNWGTLAGRFKDVNLANEPVAREILVEKAMAHYGINADPGAVMKAVKDWAAENMEQVGKKLKVKADAKPFSLSTLTPGKTIIQMRKGKSGSAMSDLLFQGYLALAEQPIATSMAAFVVDSIVNHFRGSDSNTLGIEEHAGIVLTLMAGKYARYLMNTGAQRFSRAGAAQLAGAIADNKTTLVSICGAAASSTDKSHSLKVMNLLLDVVTNEQSLPNTMVSSLYNTFANMRLGRLRGVSKLQLPKFSIDDVAKGSLKVGPDTIMGGSAGFTNAVGFNGTFNELFRKIRSSMPAGGTMPADVSNDLTKRSVELFGSGGLDRTSREVLGIVGGGTLDDTLAAVTAAETMLKTCKDEVISVAKAGSKESLLESVANYSALKELLTTGSVSSGVSQLQDMAVAVGLMPKGTLGQVGKAMGISADLARGVERMMTYAKALEAPQITNAVFEEFVSTCTKHLSMGEVVSKGLFNAMLSGATTVVESAVANTFALGTKVLTEAIKAGGNKAIRNAAGYMESRAWLSGAYGGIWDGFIRAGRRIADVQGVIPDEAAKAGVYWASRRAVSSDFGLGSKWLRVIDKSFEFMGLSAPSRYMQAMDDVCVTITASAEASSGIIRRAAEKLNSSVPGSITMEQAIASIKADPKMMNEVWTEAYTLGKGVTGQELGRFGISKSALGGPGVIVEGLAKLQRKSKVLTALVPFLGTGTRVAHAGLHYGPTALLADFLFGGNSKLLYGSATDRMDVVARVAAGTLAFAGLFEGLRRAGGRYVSMHKSKDKDLKAGSARGGAWVFTNGAIWDLNQGEFTSVAFELLDLMSDYEDRSHMLTDEESLNFNVAASVLMRAAGGVYSDGIKRAFRTLEEGDFEAGLNSITQLFKSASVPNHIRKVMQLSPRNDPGDARLSLTGEKQRVTPGPVWSMAERQMPNDPVGVLMADHGIDIYRYPKDILEAEGIELPVDIRSKIVKGIGSMLNGQYQVIENSIKRAEKRGEDPVKLLKKHIDTAKTKVLARYNHEITNYVNNQRRLAGAITKKVQQ